MFDVSLHSLKLLAATVWYSGGLILLFKGSSLLLEAERITPGRAWFWYTILIGVSIGVLKVIFIFRPACLKNLHRIAGLKHPKIWQLFRPSFLVFLPCMILLGAFLSRAAHNNYPFLLGVAILDFSIAVALLGSSYIFWGYRFIDKD